METIPITKENAQKALAQAPEEFKAALRALFGGKIYRDPMEVESYEELCEGAEVDPVKSLPFQNPAKKRHAMCNGAFKLDVIFEEFNKLPDGTIWEPDYGKPKQEKHYPWGEWSPSVGGFVFTYTYFTRTFTCLGARFCTNTAAKAKRIATVFNKEWNEFLYPKI